MGSPPVDAAFCSDPNVDRLFAMVFALSAELTAVSEQLDTLRRVISEHGILGSEAVSGYVPSASVVAERERARRAFVETLMASFERDAQAFEVTSASS